MPLYILLRKKIIQLLYQICQLSLQRSCNEEETDTHICMKCMEMVIELVHILGNVTYRTLATN